MIRKETAMNEGSIGIVMDDVAIGTKHLQCSQVVPDDMRVLMQNNINPAVHQLQMNIGMSYTIL